VLSSFSSPWTAAQVCLEFLHRIQRYIETLAFWSAGTSYVLLRLFYVLQIPIINILSAGPKGATLRDMFDDEAVDRRTYWLKLNDLCENCAFWFPEGLKDPVLIMRQGDSEVSVDVSGNVSGVSHKPHTLMMYYACVSDSLFFSYALCENV